MHATDELSTRIAQRKHDKAWQQVAAYRALLAADEAALVAEAHDLAALPDATKETIANLVKQYGGPASENWPARVQKTWNDRRDVILAAQRIFDEHPQGIAATLDTIRSQTPEKLRTWHTPAVARGASARARQYVGGAAKIPQLLAEISAATQVYDEAYAAALEADRIATAPRVKVERPVLDVVP
jgi:hypothetical protein